MASEVTKPSRPPKPSTRSSLRNSLNFTSVGKALADVINKDTRDRDGALKKPKDQKSKSPTPPYRKEDSPSFKTITRRRQSALLKQGPSSSDEHGVKSPDPNSSSPSRRSTLRSKTASSTISALPKYRPRSAIIEPTKKPLSPIRAGTRRRFSTSEEDDGEQRDSPKGTGTLRSPTDKVERPISPLPHRALAVKVNLPSPTAPSTPTKSKIAQSVKSGPSPARAGSVRLAKTVKTTATSSPSRAPATRPPSSASSSSSSRTHPSPLNPTSLKNAFGFGLSKASSRNSTPLRDTLRQPPESPLAHHARQNSVMSLGGNGQGSPARPWQGDEGNSEDSVEIEDVELLLAPVASLAAPTPAIPRIRTTTCQSPDPELQTPSRPSNLLPTRANLSYLSPLPPSESSPVLRPRSRGNDQNHGSIFSWEMAVNNSQILAREDLEGRLADVVAPFTPGASPNPSTIGLETPNLSTLPSPSGYGSISQVLLPDVTPSPAVYHLNAIFETSVDLPPPADSGTTTLLRLQIAQAESIAKERLSRLQELEEQLYAVKQSRIRETEELAKQISVLEQQLRTSVETRERMDEERAAFTVSLQDELKQADARCDQAAQAGFERGQQAARLSWDATLAKVHRSWEASCAAKEAACLWSSAKDQADAERSHMESARQMLNVFMAVLDHNQKRLQGLLA
ncbi:hypothetical protein L210DRAFT_2965566 [Boletus edulis BED1]|uniref:Uncharacterized protein n=1 Tax=Boletus edulis BED1 TaxID=1328754 RepID=A0AAD4C1Z4_BOLED|nr:hypothetical protein L210DRAFT_2965566 [Boletus edulis BED1]